MSLSSVINSRVGPLIARIRWLRRIAAWLRSAWDYADMIFWLLRDVFAQFRWRSLRIVLSGAGHLGTRYAAMGIMYYFIRLFEQRRPLVLLDRELLQPDSPGFLLLGVLLPLAILIISVVLRFDVRNQSIRVGRQYQVYGIRRIIMLVSRLPDPRAPLASRLATAGPLAKSGRLSRFAGYARNAGIIARKLGQAIPAIAGLVLAAVILLAIDAKLTLLIALVVVVMLAAQYPANRRAAKASRSFENHRSGAMRQVKGVLGELQRAPVPLAMGSPVLDMVMGDESFRGSIRSFARRRRAIEEASLASRIGGYVILASTLLLLGLGILEGDINWGHAAVYVGVMRFSLQDFVRASRAVVGINRFHAQMSRYIAFVRSAITVLRGPDPSPVQDVLPLEFSVPALKAHDGVLTTGPGAVLALLAPARRAISISGMVFGTVTAANSGLVAPPFGISRRLIDAEVPLKASLGLPEGVTGQEVWHAIQGFAPENEPCPWLGTDWLDRTPEEPWDRILPDWAIFALQAQGARERTNAIILADDADLAAMPATWRRELRTFLGDRVLIVVHGSLQTLGRHAESAVVLCDTKAPRFWVPLTERPSDRKRIAEAYASIVPLSAQGQQDGAGLNDDDDDDDDDDE